MLKTQFSREWVSIVDYLMVEHEQKSAFNVHVAGSFDLETIGLLSGGHPVPLKIIKRRSTNKSTQVWCKHSYVFHSDYLH